MTEIYHITHVRNLPSIIRAGGMFCDTTMNSHNVEHVGIAHNHIKARRAKRVVELPPHGTLADFVPFYFAPRSPMLYSINGGYVDGYSEGQGAVLHLVSSVETVLKAARDYVFTDGHAELVISRFFKDTSDLSKVDWAIMKERYWNDTMDDNDRKRRRQAEFLVHDFFPWELVERIGVIDAGMQSQVESIMSTARHRPVVEVRRAWYY